MIFKKYLLTYNKLYLFINNTVDLQIFGLDAQVPDSTSYGRLPR
jgi:hypothetical protein